MSEKPSHERISRDLDESPERKESISNSVSNHGGKGKGKKAEEVERIDKMALAPGVTAESFAHLDEKKILRKMDWHLIPMLALLYLLSFLDRGNIGNAKIEGLQETLGMTGAQYNWCLTAFFFTYVYLYNCRTEKPTKKHLVRLGALSESPIRRRLWRSTVLMNAQVRRLRGPK